jgi:hypothetical protein
VYFLLDGQSWNRSRLLNRQGLREWVCLLETVKLDIKYRDSEVLAEAHLVKL